MKRFASRIAGLKDSSGDMAFARSAAAIAADFAVFPSTEACLLDAQRGAFCRLPSRRHRQSELDLCARAFNDGDQIALDAAVAIRKLFEGRPLVSGR